MKSNLTQGNPAAKPQNSPGPLAKTKRTNLALTKPMAKARNVPKPYAKNREATTIRPGPTNTPPPMPDADRIRNELISGKRSNSHSRKGR